MVRVKSRYLLFEINFEDDLILESLTSSSITTIVKESIEANFGSFGSGVTSSIQIKYFSPFTNIGILRMPREHGRMVWASLTFITKIKKIPCRIRVLHVSGTIKSAQKHTIEYNQKMLLKLQNSHVLSRTFSSIS